MMGRARCFAYGAFIAFCGASCVFGVQHSRAYGRLQCGRHAFHLLPPPRYDLENYAQTVSKIVLERAVDVIIPTCEEVFYLAMIKHRIDADIWCPDAADLARVQDKFAFVEMPVSWG